MYPQPGPRVGAPDEHDNDFSAFYCSVMHNASRCQFHTFSKLCGIKNQMELAGIDL